MNNTSSKICIGILIVCFLAMVVGVILTVMENAETAGNLTGAATALCVAGWFLACRNMKRVDEGDFSTEGKRSRVFEKLLGRTVYTEIPLTDSEQEDIPESEWL